MFIPTQKEEKIIETIQRRKTDIFGMTETSNNKKKKLSSGYVLMYREVEIGRRKHGNTSGATTWSLYSRSKTNS